MKRWEETYRQLELLGVIINRGDVGPLYLRFQFESTDSQWHIERIIWKAWEILLGGRCVTRTKLEFEGNRVQSQVQSEIHWNIGNKRVPDSFYLWVQNERRHGRVTVRTVNTQLERQFFSRGKVRLKELYHIFVCAVAWFKLPRQWIVMTFIAAF